MVLIVVSVVLFIVFYGIVTFGKEKEDTIENNQVPVPKLGEGQEQYDSKMEAIEALKEERETNAPSVYDETLLDSLGYYNADGDSIRKKRLMDSVYFLGEKRRQNLMALRKMEENYSKGRSSGPMDQDVREPNVPKKDGSINNEKELKNREKEMGLEHQLFFASDPVENPDRFLGRTDGELMVRVDGTQTVRQDHRLRMRLCKPAKIGGVTLDRNTLVYGFVSFKPNRTLLKIENMGGRSVQFEAYDIGDGSKGIYIENSFSEDMRKQVIGDVVDDITVPGMPQISGIKQLFRRGNRQVRVTVMDNYQLLLKRK
ncbi:conjugative transposon protein TraM [Galbibacter mesophilus]|uniref:conjugative transposon protein TraM n=1 Tax=Galbibacter mesophilus TaxID=379069 RepID=UPI001F5C7520|nr:conjugative transposon protein TraM [Galbibacter mesophilus]MCM5663629.1 conjugative transposon protein TraM [Galbibacter mesophilus]